MVGTGRSRAPIGGRDPRLQQPLPAGPRGTRPRIDDGRLGITIAGAPTGGGSGGRLPQRPWREWTAADFEVDADHPVPAGVDGETVQLEPPLRFRIRPGVLRVRIARRHPGASPSARLPEGPVQSARALVWIAAGRDPGPVAAVNKLALRPPNRSGRDPMSGI